ncbi:unnamed protein product, partial [Rotaria sordida]
MTKILERLTDENILEIVCKIEKGLKGFEYLHLCSKIHREIKAQNILFTNNGHSKLAAFDVAGQLTV